MKVLWESKDLCREEKVICPFKLFACWLNMIYFALIVYFYAFSMYSHEIICFLRRLHHACVFHMKLLSIYQTEGIKLSL